MSEFLASGRVADLVLALMFGEAAVLGACYVVRGRGIAPRDLCANLLAGAFIVAAFRAVLTHSAWYWIAMALSCALLAHVWDLRQRWQTASHAGHRHAARPSEADS